MLPILIIENVEPFLSEWLKAEYEHSALHWDNEVWITNLGQDAIKELEKTQIENLKLFSKHCWDVIKKGHVLILDPQGKEKIEKKDLENSDFVIVGGILGEKIMKGRTKEKITDKFLKANKDLDVKVVNLGKYHFPIDQAVIFCEKLYKGEKIEIIENPEFVLEETENMKRVVSLPYAYIMENGKILISRKLMDLLKKGFPI